MADNLNSFDFSQPQSINTDPFLSMGSGVSESVQMADAALSAPTTQVDLIPLSKGLMDISVPYTPVPSMGMGMGPGVEESFNMDSLVDRRESATKFDIDQDEVYTEFQTKDWEDFSGFGKVRKYEQYVKGIDNDDRMARQQGGWEVAGRGLEKALVTASSMVLNTVGMIGYGIPSAIHQKSLTALIDNDFSRFVDDLNTHYQHEDIIYKSQEYRDKSAVGQVFTGTWWADTALQGVGYLVGGLAVGGATGAALKGIGLVGGTIGGASRGVLSELTRSALAGDAAGLAQKQVISEFKKAIAKDLAKTTLKSSVANVTTLITSAAPEAQMESLQFIKDAENQYLLDYNKAYGRPPSAQEMLEYKEGARGAANGVFAANLALVGASNFLQFGDLLGADKVFKKGIMDGMINRTFGLGLEKTVVEAGKEGLESATWEVMKRTGLQKAGYRVFTALESPMTEGLWEEGMQSVVQNTAADYMRSKYDPDSMNKNKSIIKSFADGFAHTYGTKEGWQEILAGMVVGGLGSFRGGKGGVDFLGQGGATQNINKFASDAQNLNSTQEDFIAANQSLLEAQQIYNGLSNESIKKLNDRIGNSNQQVNNSDKARAEAAKGNLEQAQLYYTNAVFSKLMAEKRAGLSDSNKFDIDMMIDNVPSETLKDMYGFRNEEEINSFKERTKLNLENQKEAFEVAYDFAEQLNLGSTDLMSSENLKEASALQFFHGMMAADTASSIARAIEDTVGVGGIASAMNYYTNLDQTNQQRIKTIEENKEKLKDLEQQKSDLLTSFSNQSEKLAREPENESVIRALDATTERMNSLNSQIEQLNTEVSNIESILSNKVNMPKLPFGNPASKFFSGINLNLADSDVVSVMQGLKDLETYMSHLQDPTGKTEQQIKDDNNKVRALNQLSGMYKNQMKLMRNFAKVANMVSDPSYGNNLYKRITRKKDTKFDNDEWVKNDKAGMDVNNEAGLNRGFEKLSDDLKAKIAEGKISEFDLHTWRSNIEIMTMTGHVLGDSNITLDQLNLVMVRDAEGNLTYDTSSELGQQFIQEVADLIARGQRLSRTQNQVYFLNKEEIDERVKEIKASQPTTIAQQIKPDHNTKLKQIQRLEKIRDQKIKEAEERRDKRQDQMFNDGTYDLSKLREDVEGVNPDLSSDMTIDEIAEQIDFAFNQEKSEIEKQFEEATTPTQKDTESILTALDQLNDVINEVINNLQKENKVINPDEVDRFDTSSIPTKKDFDRVNKLLSLGVRSAEQQSELNTLMNKINSYGLIEGRTGRSNEVPIRMSDLLEQRNQLENELFVDKKDISPLGEDEMRKMTFDSPTDNEEGPEFKKEEAVGDAAVLNTYEFSTFVPLTNGTYQIANITPQGFTEEITRDKDHSITVLDENNKVRVVDTEQSSWDSEIQPGDSVSITITDPETQVPITVSFSVDNSRRIVLPRDYADVISDHTDLSFNSKNKIGSSEYYVLTKVVDGVETYLGSDFNIELDSDAIQQMEPGDTIYFEYDAEAPYNQDLMEEYKDALPDKSAPEYEIANEVERMVKEIENNNLLKSDPMENKAELTRLNKQLYAEINLLLPSVKSNSPRSVRKSVSDMIKNYNDQFDLKQGDEIKKKIKDNMVIVAKDSSGNRVGIVKSLQNSNVRGRGRTQMDYLRTSIFDQLIENDFKPKTKTKFKVPVQIVYMGIPNIKSENGQKQVFRFSSQPGDMNINPNKITAVGYATYGEMKFSGNKTIQTPYNYAKNITTNTLFEGRRVPVVSFKHQGKDVIYPITLLEKDTVSLSERFQEVLAREEDLSFGEFISSVNTFLSENGISKGIRLTSLNYKTGLELATTAVNNVMNISTLEELMDPGMMKQVLEQHTMIDINLNDKPFVGPKIRFNLNSVPENVSPFLSEVSPLKVEPATVDEILNEIDNNICE